MSCCPVCSDRLMIPQGICLWGEKRHRRRPNFFISDFRSCFSCECWHTSSCIAYWESRNWDVLGLRSCQLLFSALISLAVLQDGHSRQIISCESVSKIIILFLFSWNPQNAWNQRGSYKHTSISAIVNILQLFHMSQKCLLSTLSELHCSACLNPNEINET